MEWIFLVAMGIFALCGAVLEWEFFMNHRKAQFFINLFGRKGTRVFYSLLGTGFIVLGILLGTGMIDK